MNQIVECVPNISEGRNKMIINKIAESINSVYGIKLLNIDSGFAVNRTVFTFIGEPNKIVEAVFYMVKVASELIDMSLHTGEHPRIGVVDVCPFIPIKNISILELIQWTNSLAQKINNELNIPIYLYEESQKLEYRKKLEQIRKGEYEFLETKIKIPEWKPDVGLPIMNKKSGAIVLGVRNYLIAFNINLDTRELNVAKTIATIIRTSGGFIKDKNNNIIKVNGILNYCKAIAWYVKDFDLIQVSINLTNFKSTSLFDTYKCLQLIANNYNVNLIGCELVGMLPLEALLLSSKQICEEKNIIFDLLNEEAKINLAIDYFNLDACYKFNKEEKILEYKISEMN